MTESRPWLRIGFWTGSIIFAAVQIWSRHFYVSPDGIHYLDIADAYRRCDWSAAINSFWSPFYSWILAGWLGLWNSSPFAESAFAHALGFLLFLCSLGAFEFFLGQLLSASRIRRTDEDLVPVIPEDAFRALAYAVFLWAWFYWLAFRVTPDLLMSVFAYLAFGFLVRLNAGDDRRVTYALLGSCLGLAYLAKTAMFPLAFVFLGVAALSARRRAMTARILVAVLAFAGVVVPWITVLSISKHRLTYGDAGWLNYSWFIGPYYAPEAPFPDSTLPVHPTARILDKPATYAMKEEVPGTYPFSYDPSYWFEGTRSHFILRKQIRVFVYDASRVWRFVAKQSFLVAGVVFLAWLYGRSGRTSEEVRSSTWVVLVPAMAGILMYCAVWVESRYIAPFLVMVWMGLFISFRRPSRSDGQPIGWAVALSIAAATVFTMTPDALANARSFVALVRPGSKVVPVDWETARALNRVGVRRGDRIVVVGRASNAYWARVAGVKIVAVVLDVKSDFEEVGDSDSLLQPDGALTREALAAFRSTGARAVIARTVPRRVADHGWLPLGTTGFYAYDLRDSHT